MAKSETLHIRVEPSVRQHVEATLKQLGISTTDAVNMFLNQIVLTGGIPFAVKLPAPNEQMLLAMHEAIEVNKSGVGYTNMDDLRNALND